MDDRKFTIDWGDWIPNTCQDELHLGDWCAWCQRFISSDNINDGQCIAARRRLADKITAEIARTSPRVAPLSTWWFLGLSVALAIAGCAIIG